MDWNLSFQIILLISIISIIALFFGAKNFIKTYFDEKAKHLATKENFNELLENLKKQTKETENIKKEIEDIYGYKTIKRKKLEILLEKLFQYEKEIWLYGYKILNNDKIIINNKFDEDKLSFIIIYSNLYFSQLIEFTAELGELNKDYLVYINIKNHNNNTIITKLDNIIKVINLIKEKSYQIMQELINNP